MKDVLGTEIKKGDLLALTDYDRSGLYFSLVTKVHANSVELEYGSKRSSDHIMVANEKEEEILKHEPSLRKARLKLLQCKD